MKYTTALDSRRSTMAHIATNQKQAAATEGSTEGRCGERDALGEARYHHFWGIVSWITGINYNKIVEFSNQFFLGRFVLFTKTQPLRPWSTPSPEATGVGCLEMQNAMPLDRRPTPPWWCSLLDGSTLVNHLFVLVTEKNTIFRK